VAGIVYRYWSRWSRRHQIRKTIREQDVHTIEATTMNEMMDGGAMMWGTGWWGLLILVLVVLAVGALAKYLFFDKRR
jgi:mevalonate pyrophosphate decarboxylase